MLQKSSRNIIYVAKNVEGKIKNSGENNTSVVLQQSNCCRAIINVSGNVEAHVQLKFGRLIALFFTQVFMFQSGTELVFQKQDLIEDC